MCEGWGQTSPRLDSHRPRQETCHGTPTHTAGWVADSFEFYIPTFKSSVSRQVRQSKARLHYLQSSNHGRRRAATSYSELWPHITAYDTPQLRKYYADGQSGTAKKKAPPRCQNSQVPRRGRAPPSAPSARRQPQPPTTKPTILPRGRRATPRKPNDLRGAPEHEVGVSVIVQRESRSPTRSASTWQARTGQTETREAYLSAHLLNTITSQLFAAQASTCAQRLDATTRSRCTLRPLSFAMS